MATVVGMVEETAGEKGTANKVVDKGVVEFPADRVAAVVLKEADMAVRAAADLAA